MPKYNAFNTDFSDLSSEDWLISNYANSQDWIDTAFSPDYIFLSDGVLSALLDGTDTSGKDYTGGEVRTQERYFYGLYEVTMQASPDDGTLSSFFTYTGAPHGTARSEIDFEFLGADTTRVLLSYYTPDGDENVIVDLGFDAAEGFHQYSFDWQPDSITWYADGVELWSVTTSDIGFPSEPSYIYLNIWTGANSFTGTPSHGVSTTASYSDLSYTPRTAPVAVEDELRVSRNGAAEIDVVANDGIMGNVLLAETVSIVRPPEHGMVSVDPTSGRITYTPDSGYSGFDTFSYTVSNETETSNEGDVTVVVGIPVYEDFADGADSFTYVDDAFRGTDQPDYASGAAESGLLRVTLGGQSLRATVSDISGGWSQGFDSLAGQAGTLTLRYRLALSADLDAGEYAEVLVLIDGTEYVIDLLEATDDD
ncbi:family 16 glycosylhydrolase, partial [Alloyangia pacifica]